MFTGALIVIATTLSGLVSYKIGQTTEDARFTSTVSDNVSFEKQSYPDGWSNDLPDRDKGTQSSDRNPLPATYEGCTYSKMTAYLPANNAGKGSEYLSRNLAYQYAESLGEQSPNTSISKVTVNGKRTGAIKAEWDKRIIIVRAFDSGKAQKAPKDLKDAPPKGVSTATDEGVPAIILDYSCSDDSDFNPETAKEMFKATSIIK